MTSTGQTGVTVSCAPKDPLVQAIASLVGRCGSWKGSPSALMEALGREAGELRLDTEEPRWPRNSSWLSRRLHQARLDLISMGVELRETRSSRSRGIILRRVTRPAILHPANDGNDGITGEVEKSPLSGPPEEWPGDYRAAFEREYTTLVEDGAPPASARARAIQRVRDKWNATQRPHRPGAPG